MTIHDATILNFSIEPVEIWLADGRKLFVLHREEITKDKDVMILEPDEEYYRKQAATGHLLIVTARYCGTLVGYVVWNIDRHPHYKSVICAQEDVHYLHPLYRRGLAGYLFLKHAIAVLRGCGVRYYYLREKIGHEHPAMMRRLGVKPLDITYAGRFE